MKIRPTLLTALALGTALVIIQPSAADPLSQRDMAKVIQQTPKRYLQSEPGKQEQLSLLFGPYVIPPGQDANRLTLDVHLPPGFVTAVSPDLVDAASGRVPTEQEAHIHHAHWFRITDDPDELYYLDGRGLVDGYIPDFIPQEVVDALPESAGISWVFGTGEEKTQGGFELREALEDANNDGRPDRRYGIEIDQAERQLLIYMIHNKTSAPLEVFVVLDVDFTHGTSDEIEASTGTPMHALKGQLFGQTRDALRNYPALIGTNGSPSQEQPMGWRAELDGRIIVAGGHAHPGAYGVFLTNQGPGGACTADVDNDGFPGVTILKSRKIDHVPGTWPYSEDYQMGVAKYGWRAPIHEGDVLTQYAVYDIDNESTMPSDLGAKAAAYALPGNYGDLGGPTAADLGNRDTVDGATHQHFQAMNHVGVYIDPQLKPPAYSKQVDPAGCPANFQDAASAWLIGEDTPALQQALRADDAGIAPYFAPGVTEGMQNHVWPALDPTCGSFEYAARTTCENGNAYTRDGTGIETGQIHIAGFQYVPGGLGLPGPAGAPARVAKGSTLTIYNDDVAGNIRHTLTTCAWPCTGGYVSNYPMPDGLVDTGKLGNIDPIDGGLTGDDTVPIYELDTAELEAGFYSYYCRIHPSMRGAFEVFAA